MHSSLTFLLSFRSVRYLSIDVSILFLRTFSMYFIAHQDSNLSKEEAKKLPKVKGHNLYRCEDGYGFVSVESVIYLESLVNCISQFYI